MVGFVLALLHIRVLMKRGFSDLAFAANGLYMILINPISWWHFAPFLIFSGLLILVEARRQSGWKAWWVVPLALSILGILPSHYGVAFYLSGVLDLGKVGESLLFISLAKPGTILTLIQLGLVIKLGRFGKAQGEGRPQVETLCPCS